MLGTHRSKCCAQGSAATCCRFPRYDPTTRRDLIVSISTPHHDSRFVEFNAPPPPLTRTHENTRTHTHTRTTTQKTNPAKRTRMVDIEEPSGRPRKNCARRSGSDAGVVIVERAPSCSPSPASRAEGFQVASRSSLVALLLGEGALFAGHCHLPGAPDGDHIPPSGPAGRRTGGPSAWLLTISSRWPTSVACKRTTLLCGPTCGSPSEV